MLPIHINLSWKIILIFIILANVHKKLKNKYRNVLVIIKIIIYLILKHFKLSISVLLRNIQKWNNKLINLIFTFYSSINCNIEYYANSIKVIFFHVVLDFSEQYFKTWKTISLYHKYERRIIVLINN